MNPHSITGKGLQVIMTLIFSLKNGPTVQRKLLHYVSTCIFIQRASQTNSIWVQEALLRKHYVYYSNDCDGHLDRN